METQTRTGGTVQGRMAPATGLIQGDRIIATLAAASGAARLNVAYTFDHEGFQVDGRGTRIGGPSLKLPTGQAGEPVFPLDQYRELIQQNEKQAADRLTVEYKTAYDTFRQNGGGSIAESIRQAVLALVHAELGIPKSGDAKWNLDGNQVGVVAPVRREVNEPGAWLVQATPVWGF